MSYRRLFILFCCAAAFAQKTAPAGGSPRTNQPLSTFQSKVNLVLVPVVVRDAHGQPVGNLAKSDFQLFDKGKQQNIVSFSMVHRASLVKDENPGAAAVATATDVANPGFALTAESSNSSRYILYLFDDLNTRFADMAHIRDAAVRHFERALNSADGAAVETFTGRPTLEFTNDRQKLQETLSKVRWRPADNHVGFQCPDVSYYVSNLIMEKGDGQAFQALVQHTSQCAHVRPELAVQIAQTAVNRELIIGARDTQIALRTLRRAIRRLSAMPGQRMIVLASPGFFAQTPEAIKATAEILDLAAKSNVIVSGLSARGVVQAEEEEDVATAKGMGRKETQSSPKQLWMRYRRESARAGGDVMQELAEGTGGLFFHNNNDLDFGFERVATLPEFSYVLGFSPTALKADGRFHALKVRVPGERGISVEARHGYYALREDSKDTAATAAMDDAVFSRDQISDIPVVLQTGHSKPGNGDVAKILAVAKVDVTSLHLEKRDGRNRGSLRAVCAIFDSEGGYVTGDSKTVNLNLRDETLAQTDSGFTLRWDFEVKPGAYVIRLVVREAGGKAMTTVNRTVTIP